MKGTKDVGGKQAECGSDIPMMTVGLYQTARLSFEAAHRLTC